MHIQGDSTTDLCRTPADDQHTEKKSIRNSFLLQMLSFPLCHLFCLTENLMTLVRFPMESDRLLFLHAFDQAVCHAHKALHFTGNDDLGGLAVGNLFHGLNGLQLHNLIVGRDLGSRSACQERYRL